VEIEDHTFLLHSACTTGTPHAFGILTSYSGQVGKRNHPPGSRHIRPPGPKSRSTDAFERRCLRLILTSIKNQHRPFFPRPPSTNTSSRPSRLLNTNQHTRSTTPHSFQHFLINMLAISSLIALTAAAASTVSASPARLQQRDDIDTTILNYGELSSSLLLSAACALHLVSRADRDSRSFSFSVLFFFRSRVLFL
jgi:hypothetical protein